MEAPENIVTAADVVKFVREEVGPKFEDAILDCYLLDSPQAGSVTVSVVITAEAHRLHREDLHATIHEGLLERGPTAATWLVEFLVGTQGPYR